MIPTLAGAFAAVGFDPVVVTSTQTISIPAGASTVDVYLVTIGGNAVVGSSGDGGDCIGHVGVAIVGGSTGITINPGAKTAIFVPSGSITLPLIFKGGGGRAFNGSTGGAAGTEVAAGPSAVLDGGTGTPGPLSVTTGSVLAGYVGHGGDHNTAYNGVGWGAGGGISGDGSVKGTGGPAGAVVIFK